MKNSHETYAVANYLSGSGIYGGSANPYSRTYSEVMEATGFFNMYRIEKAYPDLIVTEKVQNGIWKKHMEYTVTA